MTLYQIYELVNYISGKFVSGNAIPPARFNILCPQSQDELVQGMLRGILAASTSPELYSQVMNTTPLLPFKKSEAFTPDLTDGSSSLPDDYLQYIDAFATAYAENNTSIVMPVRQIEIVSEKSFAERRGDITYMFDTFPFAKITGGKLYIIPFNYLPTLEYFRKPAVPFLDYCQETVNMTRIIYMPVGSYIQTGNLYDSADQLLYTGVTKQVGGVVPALYRSQTVELEWGSEFHYKLVYPILAKAGVNLGEGEVEKYAIQMTQQP